MSAPCIAVTGLAALAVAMGIGRFAFTPILPMMQADAGLSVADGAWLASANYAGYLLGALAAVGMRVRPGPAIRASLLAIGLATLAMGLQRQLLLWILLRALAGVASAWVLVFVSIWALERLAQAGRPGLSGTVYAGVGAGIVAAGAGCLLLMHLHSASDDAWLWLGVLSLAVTAAIWPFLKANAPSKAAPAAGAVALGVRSAEHWRLVLCYGGFGFGYIIPATFLPAMAQEITPDPQLFGWAWPVFGAAAVVSTLLAARLKRVMPPRKAWIAGNLVMAAGVVIPLALPGLAGIMTAAFCVGGTFMVITMAGIEEARRVAGLRAHTLTAAMTSAFALGQIAGPLGASFLAGSKGEFSQALVVAAAVLAVSSLFLMHGDAK